MTSGIDLEPRLKKCTERDNTVVLSFRYPDGKLSFPINLVIPYLEIAYGGREIMNDNSVSEVIRKPGFKALANWLEMKFKDTDFANIMYQIATEYTLTPSFMKKVYRQRRVHYVDIPKRKGGWGGHRKGSGFTYQPSEEALQFYYNEREAAIKEAAESWMLQPYKRLENAFERVYHRKASKGLLKQFMKEVELRQKSITDKADY